MEYIWNELRQGWKRLLIGDNTHDLSDKDIQNYIMSSYEKAEVLYKKMSKCSQVGRTYLWEDIPMNEKETHKGSSQVTLSYDRLKVIAIAYGIKGSKYYKDESVRTEILAALELMNEQHYNSSFKEFGNWYDWHIGTPLRYLDVLFIMDEDLEKEQLLRLLEPIQRFTPRVEMTGANRVWKAQIVALSGILEENEEKLEDVKLGLKEIFEFVTEGDGFYEEGSFVQHGYFPYTGGYGKAFIVTIAPLMNLLVSSQWALKYEEGCEKNLHKMVFEAYEPLIYKGLMMDMVRNREISRIGGQDHIAGRQVIRAMIYMIDVLEGKDKERAKQMIKYWLEQDKENQVYTDPEEGYFLEYYVSLPVILMAKALVGDEKVRSRGPLILHKRYTAMDRVVHSRENYRVGIAMHSDRIKTYEIINSEGTNMWHTADGMMYIYTEDVKRYSEDFWGTVDHGRLAGTTVLRKEKEKDYRANVHNPHSWVGGSDLAGYGVVGMEMDNEVHSKKSWFMFDKEIVCLGSHISSIGEGQVETIVENCKLKKSLDHLIIINGTNQVEEGEKEYLAETLFVEGNVKGGGVGYYFIEKTPIHVLKETRRQKWNLMNNYEKFKEDSLRENLFCTAWLNHGNKPKKDTYAYIILPGQTKKQLEDYAKTPTIEVIGQDEGVHGVRHKALGIVGINFWNEEGARKGIEGVSSNYPISMIYKEKEGILEGEVSDPTQKQGGVIAVKFMKEMESVLRLGEKVSVVAEEKSFRIEIDVTNARGRSHGFKIKLK